MGLVFVFLIHKFAGIRFASRREQEDAASVWLRSSWLSLRPSKAQAHQSNSPFASFCHEEPQCVFLFQNKQTIRTWTDAIDPLTRIWRTQVYMSCENTNDMMYIAVLSQDQAIMGPKFVQITYIKTYLHKSNLNIICIYCSDKAKWCFNPLTLTLSLALHSIVA